MIDLLRRTPPDLHALVSVDGTAPADETQESGSGPDEVWSSSMSTGLPRISHNVEGEVGSLETDLVPERILGEGGMGVVTLCRQRSLPRKVAVKTVRAGVVHPGAAQALLQEARITGALEHPGIVPVHALGSDADGLPVMVMKRVSGVVWRALLRDPQHPGWARGKGDPLSFHLDVLRRVCDTVQFAHSRGVLHRDLKTGNVMIGEFGEVYVLDWGIACSDGHRDDVTAPVVGTPGFMAPEMLSGGAQPLTPRTDVYLLGAMLHEVLTGHPRHSGATLIEVLLSAWYSKPVEYPAGVAGELGVLCNRATHVDPAERPADAREFAEALQTFQEHRVSEHLTDAACARLKALRALTPGADHSAAQRLWTEAGFGFRQALEAWPDNTRAIEGQRQLTAWRVRHELARRNPDGVEGLFGTLDPVPSEFAVALDRLGGELRAEAAEVTQLRGLARDHDPHLSSRERARAAGAVVVGSGAILLVLAALQSRGVVSVTHPSLALVLAIVAVLAVALTWWWRAVFLSNRVGRQLVAMPFVALGSALASLGVGALLGIGPAASAVVGLLMVSGVFAAMGVALDRRLFLLAGTTLGATLLGAAMPARVVEVTAIAGLCASVEVALLFRAISREATGPSEAA